MKNKILLIFLVLMLSLILVACSSDEPEVDSTQADTKPQSQVSSETEGASETEISSEAEVSSESDEALPVFTAEDLSKYTGKDGNPAYVAYEGKVYDVSNIPAWKNGIHQNQFEAGKDYTDILNNQAPHSPDNLTKNAPIVGLYE